MKIHFLRHADALDGIDDYARPLSPKGTQQSERIGRFLKETSVCFDAVYSSPLVRAQQTAELVCRSAEAPETLKVQLTDVLLNETSQLVFDRWLADLTPVENVLLVGHAPSLSARLAMLIGCHSAESVAMSKGALACVELYARGRGQLKFFLGPKLMRS